MPIKSAIKYVKKATIPGTKTVIMPAYEFNGFCRQLLTEYGSWLGMNSTYRSNQESADEFLKENIWNYDKEDKE